MERKLVKGGIYSFIIGLLIGVVVFPDKETIKLGQGLSETTYEPMRTYLIKLIRFSSVLSLLAIVGIWIKGYFVITNKKTTTIEFIKGIIKAFLYVLAVILLALLIISGIR